MIPPLTTQRPKPHKPILADIALCLCARADGALSGCTIWRHHPAPPAGASA